MSLHLRYAAVSDRGVVRQGNQDSLYAGPHFIAVADGMGGMAAGDLASAIVINTIARLDEPPPADSVADELADTIAEANRAIRRAVADDPQKEGMGTTLTAMWFDGEWFNMVHIGDSRAYRMREGGFEQITVDDTYVQMLVDEGRITAEEAERHPQRSLLLRALGASEVEPAFQTLKGVPGDRILLCSDGLTGPVSDADIALTLQSAAEPSEAVESLVSQALEAGAPDNVTVLIADVVEDDPGEQAAIVGGAAADARLAESDTAVLPTIKRGEKDEDAAEEGEADSPQEGSGAERGRAGRVWRTVLGAAVIAAIAVAGGLWWLRAQYFIGVSEAGNISVFRGVPVEVAGVQAAWLEIESERPAADAVEEVRADLDEGIDAEGIDDAQSDLAELTDASAANDNLLPLCSAADGQGDSVPAAAPDCRED
ncbi:protein phosphatase 2C domain-containing protein [Glycomyces albus]